MICHYFARLLFATHPPHPTLHPNVVASLVALVHNIINFVIRLFKTHLFTYLELFTGFAEQFMMVL